MPSLRLLLLFIIINFCWVPLSLSQAYPYDPVEDVAASSLKVYHGSDIDSVDLDTGVLTVRIPLLSYPQRGGVMHVDYQLLYSGVLGNPNAAMVQYTEPIVGVGEWMMSQWGQMTGLPALPSVSIPQNNFPRLQTISTTVGTSESYFQGWVVEPNGSAHLIGWINATQGRTLDGSGFFVNGTIAPYSITDMNGVTTSYASGSSTVTATDPNGNQITSTTSGIIDTMGRQFSSTYPGLNGGTFSFGLSSTSTVYTVTLPNNSNYTFTFTKTSLPLLRRQTTAQTVPLLTQITLPTGGTISYTYASAPVASVCGSGSDWYFPVLTRSVNSNDGTGAHTWTYSYTPSATSSGVTTVTDPEGNKSTYTFGLDSCNPFPTEIQRQGDLGNLLETETRTYSYVTTSGLTQLQNVNLSNVTTTWPNGQEAELSYSYDRNNGSTFTGYALLLFNNGKVVAYDDGVGAGYTTLPWSTSATDYGSGAPGAVLRETKTTYIAFSGPNASSYLANNILSLPYTVQLLNGSGYKCSEIDYTYDTAARLFSAGVTEQHVAATNSFRGNISSIANQLSSTPCQASSTWTAINSYENIYDTGMTYQSIDPLGYTTTYAYSSTYYGTYASTVSNALGQNTVNAFDFNTGLLTSTTDPNSLTTSYSYDSMWRVAGVTHPDGGSDSISRQESSFPFTEMLTSKINSSQNKVSTYVFDGLGRVSQFQINSAAPSTVYRDTTYDPLGNIHSVSNPHFASSSPTDGLTTYFYDGLHRQCVVVPPDGTIPSGTNCPTTQPTNDVFTAYSGSTITVTDQAGKSRKSVVDGLSRIVQVFEDPLNLNYESDYTYDALGDLLTVSQKGGSSVSSNWRTRTFSYDSLSHLLKAQNPELGTVSYAYDLDGNLTTKTDARNIVTTLDYDKLNRLLQKSYSDSTPTVKYGYDGIAPSGCTPPALTTTLVIGIRTSMCDAAGSEAWGFAVIAGTGWQITNARTTNGVTKDTIYQQNYEGSVAALTYPSGNIITYSYDSAGNATSAADVPHSLNFASNGVYTPPGALASIQNGSTLYSTLLFNNRLQPCWIYATTTSGVAPTSCTQTGLANATVLDYQFNFGLGASNNGNVNQVVNRRDSTRTQNFTYDSLNRISSAETQTTGVTIPNSNCWGLTFGYDAWGNLLSSTASGPTGCSEPQPSNFTVNTSNQISSNSVAGQATNYCYDASGNLIYITAPSTACPTTGPYQYTYNAEEELTSAGGVTYTYDGDGRRVMKSNGTIFWYGSGSDPLDETDLAGNVNNSSFGEYVFFGGARIARRDSSSNVDYYFSDHLGSSRVVTNASGTILDDSDFYPFGAERPVVGPASGNHYKFNGKELDSESGLNNFDFRYLSSSAGRLMSPDPLGGHVSNPQSLNRYSYVLNNPLNRVDPFGLQDTIHLCLTLDANGNGAACSSSLPPPPDLGTMNSSDTPSPDLGGPQTGPTPPIPDLQSGDSSLGSQAQTPEQLQSVGSGGSGGTGNSDLANVQTGLGLLGAIPGPVGSAANLINSGIYIYRGQYGQAALSAAFAIPIVGTIGRAAELGEGALQAAKGVEGIYEFTAASGKIYVGQSGNIGLRLAQHLESGKLLEEGLSSVRFTEVSGGKLAREIAEQLRINQLGGIGNLENIRNAIGPAREYLMTPFKF